MPNMPMKRTATIMRLLRSDLDRSIDEMWVAQCEHDILAGKIGYLVVLDAQRTLFELKQQYIETLADYHTSRTALERLVGQSIQQ